MIMDIKTEEAKEDKFFERKIIRFSVRTAANETAKREDIKKTLREKHPEGFLIIYTMKNSYGKREINGVVHIYKDEAHAKRIVQKHILKKNGVVYAEQKPKEEAK